jgi:ATP-dependent DNA helicase RecG
VRPRPLSELAEVNVSQLRHAGPKRVAALREMGIESVFDLLTHYPRRYLDRTRRADLSDLAVGEEAAVFAEVVATKRRRTRQGRDLVEVRVADGDETLTVVFFNQAWRERQLVAGVQALFFGTLATYQGRRQMTNPVVDVLVGPSGEERDATRVGRLVPLYPTSAKAGLTSWEIGGFVEESLRRAGPLVDPLDATWRERLEVIERTDAFWGIHLPADLEVAAAARRRLVLDEFLRLQLLVALRRRRLEAQAAGIAHRVDLADLDVAPGGASDADSLLKRFLAGHRFALTGAQRRVLTDILTDLGAPRPMHRLLQGDVGSGKTMVALAAALVAVEGGRQVALMAPTEVLAEQLAAVWRRDLAGLRVADPSVLGGTREVVVELLTGRLRAAERRGVLERVARGAVDLVVGTHALLTEDVAFATLGLVVIDEQHRFGVEQRATLRDKGRAASAEGRDPDLLVMTATPIPRTAALVIFGDLDRSTLDELPAGRQGVATAWEPDPEGASRAWAAVREAAAQGRRSYVVCPLVEGSERVAATSAVEERERLAAGELAGLRVGLLTGQMRAADKEAEMERFRSGELDVLVATVVIEVGVDVAEATVIVIEDAWRFGLAQLHQLRGRVGRGDDPGWCFLLGEAPSAEARARLEAMVATTDGFALAEVDLDLRGEGTLLGTRQRGRSDLRLASLRRDGDLLELARGAAAELVEDLDGHAELVAELRLFLDPEESDYLFKS